jgi:hypothetical protein
VFEALRDRSWYMALGLAHLPCFAVWIFVPEITPMWFVVFLGVVLIAVPVVSAIAPRDSGLPIVIHRLWVLATSFVFLCAVVPASWLIPNLWEILVLPLLIAGVVVLISYGCKSIVSKPNHALLCTGTVCVVMVVTFVTNAEPKNVNRFVLDILPDIKWMNANLPTDALVVTTENRLWFLQRNSMAADDYRLEKFYRLTSPEASVGQLRAIGITHAYRSHRTSAFFRLFKRKEILWPAESNPHVRKIYESDSGVVVQIVSDNNVDSGGSGNP